MNDKYLNLVEEFTDIYLSKPIKNNQGGMGFNHSFALFCILREENPSFVVESGVFKGQSTFIIENSLPDSQIISLDVNFDNLEYRSKNVEYLNTDFNSVNWSKYNTRDSVCFFDDHQNSLERLKEMKWWGFRRSIFEDNYPTNEGDFYSLKQVQNKSGHESIQLSVDYKPKKIKHKMKRTIEEKVLNKYYFRQNMLRRPNNIDIDGLNINTAKIYEFPPLITNEKNVWNKDWLEDYKKEDDIFNLERINNFPKFKKYLESLDNQSKKREFDYGYITYVELDY